MRLDNEVNVRDYVRQAHPRTDSGNARKNIRVVPPMDRTPDDSEEERGNGRGPLPAEKARERPKG